jgi:hypothetical protein
MLVVNHAECACAPSLQKAAAILLAKGPPESLEAMLQLRSWPPAVLVVHHIKPKVDSTCQALQQHQPEQKEQGQPPMLSQES